MSERLPIVIEAQAVPSENDGLIAAAELLSDCLGAAAGGGAWPVRLEINAPGTALGASPPSVLIFSLLHEIGRTDEPIAETEARWRASLEPWLAQAAPIFLRTIFRQAGEPARDGTPSPRLERIRRLNRMIIGLSHSYGIGVIDIDRACAHIGARLLRNLGEAVAADVAGHTIVWSLLSHGLDAVIDPELQEKAKANLGDLHHIGELVDRRRRRRRERQASGA